MLRGRLLLIVVVSALASAVAGLVPTPTPASAAPSPLDRRPQAIRQAGSRFAEGRVLVRFSESASPAAVASEHGVKLGRHVGATGFRVVEANGRAAEAVRDALQRDHRVDVAQLDYVRTATAVPNDTHYASNQSYLRVAGFERAWDRVKVLDAQVIAVIDSGVDLDHPDLAGRLVPGWDFIDDDATPQDGEGHGTTVAGIAGANTNNGRGVAGASWGAKVMPLRALDDTGQGTDSDIAAAIDWAVANGARVLNLSLGGPDTSPALDTAVANAVAAGAVVVAAAGNEGVNQRFYPAAHPQAIAVGATDDAGDLAFFSNYGSWVDIAAPGTEVAGPTLSTGVEEKYAVGPGTSFASPIVAAAAALVRTQNPSWTPAQVANRLQRTAQDRGPRGIDDFYGWGFLDAGAAVGATPSGVVGVRAGDANEPNATPSRATTLGTSATGSIAPEGDVDWFRLEVPSARRVAITVTPTTDITTWFAMNPVIRLYGPDGTEVGYADVEEFDKPETLVADVAAGTHLVRVSSLHAGISPGTYTVTVSASAQAPTAYPFPQRDHVWVDHTSVATGSTEVAVSASFAVKFARAMTQSSLTSSTIQLVDGRSMAVVPATLSYDATSRVATVTPTTALAGNAPYHLRVSGVRDAASFAMPADEVVYFTTGTPPPPPTTTTTAPPTTTTTTAPPTTTTTAPPTTTTTAPPTTTTTTAPPPPPPPPARSGYWMVDRIGTVYSFGDARHYGDIRGARRNVVDLEPTPSGNGYWLLTDAGEVFSFGDARHHGQPSGGLAPGEIVTSMSANPKGAGYWLFTTRGRTMAFGGAPFYGDMTATVLNGPVLDSVSTPSGNGYYMVASDGGIFTFGDARFFGSMGGKRLNQPVQSLVPDNDNVGYWLVAADGGIFAFEAGFRGSMGSTPLNRPVTGMVRFGDGYLMVGEDGGIFNFSSKSFHGSLGSNPPPNPVVSVGGLGKYPQ